MNVKFEAFRRNVRCKLLEKGSGSSLEISEGLRVSVDAEIISVGPILCVFKLILQALKFSM